MSSSWPGPWCIAIHEYVIPTAGRLHSWFLFFFLFNFFTSGFFRRVSAQLQLNCENPQTASSCSTSKNWANPEGQALKVLLFPLPQNDLSPDTPPQCFQQTAFAFLTHLCVFAALLPCFWVSFFTQCYLPPLVKQKSNFGGKLYSLQIPVLYPQKKSQWLSHGCRKHHWLLGDF